jgi:arylsulfatase A-like enzyme
MRPAPDGAPERAASLCRSWSVGLVLATALSLLASCAESGGSGDAVTAVEPPLLFPLRVFQRGAPDLDAALRQDLATDPHLDDWMLLRDGGELLPLADAGARVVEGVLEVPAGPALLMRSVVLSAGRSWTAQVQLASEDTDPDTPRVRLAAVEGVSSGDAAMERLGERVDKLMSEPAGRLVRTDTRAGLVVAEHTLELARRERLAVVLLPVGEQGLRVSRVSVTPGSGPSLRDGEQVTEHGGADDHGVFGLKLGGDLRAAVRLPGGHWQAKLFVPDGAERLTFSVARMPETDGLPGWRLMLITSGVERLRVERPPGPASEGEPAYEEHSVDWPADTCTGRNVIVRFEQVGERPLVIAEAVIRGPPAIPRTNLLLISLDTLRADHLGYMGYGRDTSPYLDRFAAEHAAFHQHRSVSSYTLPTHASLFTGQHPLRHGAVRMYQRVPSHSLPYLPALMADAGWATAAFTGGAIMSDDYGFGTGFDRFVTTDPLEARPSAGEPVPPGVDHVAGWVEERGDEPWFLFLHTFLIHNYQPPEGILKQFDEHPDAPWRPQMPGRLLTDWSRHGNQPTADDVGHLVDLYDATIRYADQQLRRLMERLESQGLLDDTIVLITSDHGEEFWEHGGLIHGITLYEEQLHVPLLVSVPGGPSRRVDEPTSLLDLAPTLVELLGLPPLPVQDGRSLAPFLRGEAPMPAPQPLLAHLDLTVSQRKALLVESLKLHWGSTDPGLRAPASAEWGLFDVRDDPGERDDLRGARPDEGDELRELMAALEDILRTDGLAADRADLSQEVLDKLRELGYVR